MMDNGHVDNIIHYIARASHPAWTDDKEDPSSDTARKHTPPSSETDAKGRNLKIRKLMLPKNILITKEESEGVDAVDGRFRVWRRQGWLL